MSFIVLSQISLCKRNLPDPQNVITSPLIKNHTTSAGALSAFEFNSLLRHCCGSYFLQGFVVILCINPKTSICNAVRCMHRTLTVYVVHLECEF